MESSFLTRLIDLALLLLLTLMVAARLGNPDITLPASVAIDDAGATILPIEVSVASSGQVALDGVAVDIAQVALRSQTEQRAVVLRVDRALDATHLLSLHEVLQYYGRPATFLVAHETD